MRVAAGAIAQKILGNKIKIRGALKIGNHKINFKNWSWWNSKWFFCPDKKSVPKWEKYLSRLRKEGSSVGAIIEIRVTGVPIGLGEPVFDKVDALLGKAIMSIPAVKGFEIGRGFEAATLRGEENSDKIYSKNKK